MNIPSVVQKLWNYCNFLRDDGISYSDYVERLSHLLFLKMADERSRPPYYQPSPVPQAYAWSSTTRTSPRTSARPRFKQQSDAACVRILKKD